MTKKGWIAKRHYVDNTAHGDYSGTYYDEDLNRWLVNVFRDGETIARFEVMGDERRVRKAVREAVIFAMRYNYG